MIRLDHGRGSGICTVTGVGATKANRSAWASHLSRVRRAGHLRFKCSVAHPQLRVSAYCVLCHGLQRGTSDHLARRRRSRRT